MVMLADRTQVSAFDPIVYARLLARYRSLAKATVSSHRWLLLEAAHVVGQARFGPHLETHMLMLDLAARTRNWNEAAGQVMRLLLVPLGHALGRLPIGNTGRANVSAFQPMLVRPNIAEQIALARHDTVVS